MKPSTKVALVSGLSLVASWAAFSRIWPLSALLVLVGGIVLGFLSPRKSVRMLLLSPMVLVPSYSMAGGIWGYASGDGDLRGYGLPRAEFYNLDPQYRCTWSSSGCIVDGSEFMTHTPNNLAIQLLTSLFGPMRGSYAGPYPNRAEALLAVQSSTLEFLPGEYARRAAALGVPPGPFVEGLERELTKTLQADLPVAAALFKNETLVVGREKCLFLVERKTGKPYARYYYHCSTFHWTANGEWDRALAELDHAIEVDPRNPDYLKERGDVHFNKGDSAKAAADYRKALQVAPQEWWPRTSVETTLSRIQPSGS